jgi:hypothetical protein
VWTKAYPDKSIVNTWNRRTFIPAQSFSRVPDQFIGQVNAAISVRSKTGTSFTSGQGGMAGSPGRSWDRYGFGVAVANYLNGKPKELGLTTGTSPDNDPDKGAGCFVAGTIVQLADGREMAIEEVREGHRVVGKDGGISTQTGERVILELEQGEYIYGIDDGTRQDEPFFSAGHLFWTPQGWKAIDPAIARLENPQRDVSELKPGDVVFRLRATGGTGSTNEPPQWAAGPAESESVGTIACPTLNEVPRAAGPSITGLRSHLAYDEVCIRAFTRAYLPEGGRLYGLHLVDGPNSYHANGYLVAMNYPHFTVQRLAHGFARLSEAERRHLERCLTEVMPLLKHSVGPFIETALRRALAASRSPQAV